MYLFHIQWLVYCSYHSSAICVYLTKLQFLLKLFILYFDTKYNFSATPTAVITASNVVKVKRCGSKKGSSRTQFQQSKWWLHWAKSLMRIAILIKDSFAPYLRPFLTARICGVGLKCETINMCMHIYRCVIYTTPHYYLKHETWAIDFFSERSL